MSQFDDRKRASETKYQLDQELEFKAQARRAKLVGLWAAGLMGLADEAAADYAKSVVVADFDKPGDDDVLQKVLGDLTAKGVAVTDRDVRKQMDALLAVARDQIAKQG